MSKKLSQTEQELHDRIHEARAENQVPGSRVEAVQHGP